MSRAGLEPALPSFSDSCLLPLGYRDVSCVVLELNQFTKVRNLGSRIRSTTHWYPCQEFNLGLAVRSRAFCALKLQGHN